MWRIAARCLVISLLGLSLAACMPGLPSIPAFGQLLPTQSAAQPPTLIVVSSPTATSAAAPTSTATATASFTPIPTLTPTGIITSTQPPVSDTPAATQAAPTATVAGSISLDKLPPGTVYKHIRIQNASHAQMDISLHCTTATGLQTILEYEHVRNLGIQAPEGRYVYVVYVGGRQIVGSFSLLNVPGAVLTVYTDHVTVR